MILLNFTRSWVLWFFRVYWGSKSKCIIWSNLRADGSGGEVQWETVGNSWGSYLWLGKKRANYLKPFKVHFLYSDCFRLFQFLWKACFTCGPLIHKKTQHSTHFLATLLRAGCSKWCILTLKPNIPQIQKSQDIVKLKNWYGNFPLLSLIIGGVSDLMINTCRFVRSLQHRKRWWTGNCQPFRWRRCWQLVFGLLREKSKDYMDDYMDD